jgi:tryptophan 2,3-dioxygenase
MNNESVSFKDENEYVVFMRTDLLSAAQGIDESPAHDEALRFRTTHQVTELWLNFTASLVTDAISAIPTNVERSVQLLESGALCIKQCTQSLELLRRMQPISFMGLRPFLGNGSGFESPGWNVVRRECKVLGERFDEHIAKTEIDLIELHRDPSTNPTLYRLADAMIGLDEQISIWRVEHFKLAVRIIGHDVVGTKGTPVNSLTSLIEVQLFPKLWTVRTQLTRGHSSQSGCPLSKE